MQPTTHQLEESAELQHGLRAAQRRAPHRCDTIWRDHENRPSQNLRILRCVGAACLPVCVVRVFFHYRVAVKSGQSASHGSLARFGLWSGLWTSRDIHSKQVAAATIASARILANLSSEGAAPPPASRARARRRAGARSLVQYTGMHSVFRHIH